MPVNSRYACKVCGRTFAVEWGGLKPPRQHVETGIERHWQERDRDLAELRRMWR